MALRIENCALTVALTPKTRHGNSCESGPKRHKSIAVIRHDAEIEFVLGRFGEFAPRTNFGSSVRHSHVAALPADQVLGEFLKTLFGKARDFGQAPAGQAKTELNFAVQPNFWDLDQYTKLFVDSTNAFVI
jgi:hypothetical protein